MPTKEDVKAAVKAFRESIERQKKVNEAAKSAVEE